MAELSDIPIFEGSLDDRITSIVSWADSRIKKRKWTNQEILEKFAKRSAEEILQEGHVLYMNPCMDYSLVLLEMLKKNGFEPSIVIEEIDDPDYTPTRALHAALEFPHERKPYFLDINSLNIVVFDKGPYQNVKSNVKGVSILKINGEVIDPAKPVYQSLDRSSIEELDSLFEGYKFQTTVSRLIRDNTDRVWEAYQKRTRSKQNLYVVSLEQGRELLKPKTI